MIDQAYLASPAHLPPGWSALSRAERDQAYNNAAATPDRDAIVARRDADGASWRTAHPRHLDLAYAPGERTKWDMFPAENPAAPCMVFIHGGFWQYNSRENFAAVAAGARAHGWSVALPGYTLAPAISLSGIIDEIHAALDWLAAHGPAHGIAGPIILTGWSAGGHLAAAALDHPSVVAGMAVSGIYELLPLRDMYVDDLLKLSDADIAAGSPIRHPTSRKQLIIGYGSAELPEMVRQSRDFHAWRAAHHCPGALIPVAGANHFSVLEQMQNPDGELLRAMRALV